MKLDLKNIFTENSIEPQGLIHVGAYEGKDIKTYQDLGIQRVLLIEANPRAFARMNENIAEWGIKLNTQTINYAVSDYDGEGELLINSLEKSSSLFPLKYYQEIYPNVKEIKKINVTVKTLDSLLTELGIDPSEFNILNIDVPRPELVLAGARKLLPNIDVLLSQVNYESLYTDSLLIEEFDQVLQQNGFIQKAVTIPYHPAWGEAVYLNIHAINPDDPVLASFSQDILENYQTRPKRESLSEIVNCTQGELEQLQSPLNVYLALAESDELKAELEQERVRHQSTKKELQWLKPELEQNQSRLQIYLAVSEELKAELDQEKTHSQTLQAQLEEERSQHQSDQEKLHLLETEVEQTQSRLQIYLAVSEELKTELDTLNSEKQSQLDQYISELHQTKETLESTQLELNQVKDELELTRSQLAENKQELLISKEQLKLSPTQGIPANYHAHLKALAKIIAETLPES